VGVIMIAALVVALLIGVIFTPDTAGKSLQEIELERYGVIIDDQPPASTAK
jgi:MFS transporter, SP family, inositol transporter